jgi:hypothetical protein
MLGVFDVPFLRNIPVIFRKEKIYYIGTDVVHNDKFDSGFHGLFSIARESFIQWNSVANYIRIWGLHDVNCLLFVDMYFF